MKKVLFISNHNPFASSYGAEQRSNILLKAFLQSACKVDVMYIGEQVLCPKIFDQNIKIVYWNQGVKWNISRYDNLKRLCLLKMFPQSSSLVSIVYKLIGENDYDFIVCRYLPFAALAGLDRYADKLILDIDDLPVQALSAHLTKKNGIRSLYQKLMLRRIAVETNHWIRKSFVCFLPNSDQASFYNCIHLPNIPIIDPVISLSLTRLQNILFIGKLDWRPNYDGITHFIRNCWPSIISQVPGARFYIAGRGLSQSLIDEFSNIEGIKLMGFVESLIEFYSMGNIVVSPIYSGAGTNIKVAEAMSMGKACVLTPFSAKGYEQMLKDGDNVFIATDDDDMIKKLLCLLDSSQMCEAMMKQSLNTAINNFSQSRITRIINSVIKNQ